MQMLVINDLLGVALVMIRRHCSSSVMARLTITKLDHRSIELADHTQYQKIAETGARGAKYLAEEVASEGWKPTPGKSAEITFVSDSGVTVRIDGVFWKGGQILFGEAKVGNFADLTPNQKGAFDELQQGKGTFRGEGASDLRRALNIKAAEDGSFRIPEAKIVGVYIGTYERTSSQTQRMKNHNDLIRGRGVVFGRGAEQ